MAPIACCSQCTVLLPSPPSPAPRSRNRAVEAPRTPAAATLSSRRCMPRCGAPGEFVRQHIRLSGKLTPLRAAGRAFCSRLVVWWPLASPTAIPARAMAAPSLERERGGRSPRPNSMPRTFPIGPGANLVLIAPIGIPRNHPDVHSVHSSRLQHVSPCAAAISVQGQPAARILRPQARGCPCHARGIDGAAQPGRAEAAGGPSAAAPPPPAPCDWPCLVLLIVHAFAHHPID